MSDRSFSHDEIVVGIDKALIKIINDIINSPEVRDKLGIKANILSDFLRRKRYTLLRRINKVPTTGTRERPDIEIFNGHIVIEVETTPNTLEEGRRQLRNYISKYYKNITIVGIVTTGLYWEIYELQDNKLGKTRECKGNEKAYKEGSIYNTIIKSNLYNVLYNIIKNVLIKSSAYRYPPTPSNIFDIFYPILTHVEALIHLMNKLQIKNKAVYKSYSEVLFRVYSGLTSEELDKLFATHTLLQMIVNTILAGIFGKLETLEPLKACSGEELMYDISVPHLLWWRETIKTDNEARELLKDICEDIYGKAILFNWSAQIIEDVFSHLYEDFVERSIRYKVGEYYTPWWLVEYMIHHLKRRFNIKFSEKIVLDPACGSGRFLVKSFYEKVDEGENAEAAYYETIGLDIIPLATSIARAELMIAYKRKTKKNPSGTPLIFWGDFLSKQARLEAELIADMKNIIDRISLHILYDKEISEEIKKLDRKDIVIMLYRIEYTLSRFFRRLAKREPYSTIAREIMQQKGFDNISKIVYKITKKIINDSNIKSKIKELIKKYGNEIWSIPISSFLFIRLLDKIKPDIILTNPPWLKLSELPHSKWGDRIREYVKDTIIERNKHAVPGISKGAMSGDLSIVFLNVILEIINKEEGYIGIVVPAEQSYSPKSPHGAGKLFTYAVLCTHNIEGDAIYVGDAFKHGRHASLLLLNIEGI